MKPTAHAVVLGCGRSGTSIFGELFAQFPDFTYHSEPAFEDLYGYDYSNGVAIKVPRPQKGQTPSPGLPFRMQDLCDVVPEPRRIFWQVRHPLDAICSLRVGIANNWGHHPRPPDWQDWLSKPLLRRCAHHWLHINSAGYTSTEGQALVCRFEDMLADPLAFARRICSLMGLDVIGCDAALRVWARRVQNENNADFVEAECSKPYSRPDHATRLDRWRENLTAEEVATLVPLLRETAAQFGYSLPSGET